MIKQRPCVNGILAAVLSASIVPINGALAKEAKSAPAKHAVKKPAKAAPAKSEAPPPADAAPDSAAPAAGDAGGKPQ